MAAFILALILGNAVLATGAAGSDLMRKEKQVELHMQQYAKDAEAEEGKPEEEEKPEEEQDAEAEEGKPKEEEKPEEEQATGGTQETVEEGEEGLKISEMCDDDYPQGVDGDANCYGDLENITEPERCFQAADEANVTHPLASEILGSAWQNRRPKGCFSFPCSEDSKGTCYFFNPVLGQPDPTKLIPAESAIAGQPVCRRPRFLHGVHHDGTFEYTDGGCPAGYQPILSESNCSEAARCLGKPEGAEFAVAVHNHSAFHDYPEGCFIFDHPTLGDSPPKVYFNAPKADLGKPLKPIGTPLCNVSTIIMYPPGTPVDSHLHHHTISKHDSLGNHDDRVAATNYTGTTPGTVAGSTLQKK